MGLNQSKTDAYLHQKSYSLEDLSSKWKICHYSTQHQALNFLTRLNDSNKLQKYKIKIDKNFKEFRTNNLKKLQLKFVNQSVVLFIAANNETRFYIYWKSKDNSQILSLKHYEDYFSETDKDLCEFVANFLANSLQNGQLGIQQDHDINSNDGKIELHLLADSRNYNLLLIASESGDPKPIDGLLKYGIEPRLSLPTGEVTAQDLAWKGRHSKVLLKLCKANLPLPAQFDINKCSKELKRFIKSGYQRHQQLEEFAITLKILNEKGDELIVQGCHKKRDVFTFLTSGILKYITENVLLLKIQYEDDQVDLNADERKELSKIFSDRNVVVAQSERNSHQTSIYWTSKNIGYLLSISPFSEASSNQARKLYEFIETFLVESLGKSHSGIISTFMMSPESNDIDINLLADSRDYNLLLIASEQGNAEIVNILIQLRMITDLLHMDAQTIAWNKRHHDVLLELLKGNLTYPKLFDLKKCSAELKGFYKISDDLHKAIKANNQEDVKAVLSQNLGLSYYYNSSNDSALKTAIDAVVLDIYDILLEHKLKFAPHEDAEKLFEGLEDETKQMLRDIHTKHSQQADEKHVNILVANSFVSHDDENTKNNVDHIHSAFRVLNTNAFIKIILMIVAASKKFQIIFDFNRDSVSVVDPTANSNTLGLCYFSGRIIIGVKQLLDDNTKHEALGVIAHELCHFAMVVVYKNKAKPYTANDKQTMQEFEAISNECLENSEKEEIVDLVYGYSEEAYHRELIVRVVHMLAFYYNQPEKLLELREYFGRLFNFYETKVVPEMKAALPEIENKVELEIKEKDKEIFKLRKSLFILIGLVIIIIIVVGLPGWYFHEPTYKFNDLSEKNKITVQNAVVRYKNVTVKLNELFPGNSGIFVNLTSDHIAKMLKNMVLDFDDPQLHYLEVHLDLKWESLAGNLKENFLRSDLNFQGKIVKFQDLYESYPNAFNALTSQQIVDVLSGKEMKIGRKFKSEVTFFIERKFIQEDARWNDFVNVDAIDEYIKFEKQDELLKEYYFEKHPEKFLYIDKSSNEIIEQAEQDKFFILSSEAGAGKTVTFEHFAIEIKSKFPNRWVSYIDLPKQTKFYNSNKTAENLLKEILDLNPQKNNFEVRIFEESFNLGNLVLIWNAFDEISPTYNEFILNVFKSIHMSFSNVQLICTRPMYSDQLRQAFEVRTWQFLPFNEEEKREFLKEFFEFENVPSKKVQENVEKVEKIVKKLQYENKNDYNFDTPLMLRLIAEIYENETLFESANIYSIYETFVEKKIEIWLEKNRNSNKIATKLVSGGFFKTTLQKFALLNEEKIVFFFCCIIKKLQIMRKKFPEGFQIEEFSQLGILFINGKNSFEFSHKTFSEFFVAQFFIENIFDVDASVDSDEAELRLEWFFCFTKQYGIDQQLITDFMMSYLQNRPQKPKKFNPKISELLRTKFKNFFILMLDTKYPKVFEFLFEFFKPDHDLLIDLLHVHEPETFYTAIFNPNHLAIFVNPEEIKSLAQNYLTDVEFQQFLSGKNQKGKILFGAYFYNLNNIKKLQKSSCLIE